jgi:hypothetical protein
MNRILGRVRQRLGLRTTVRRKALWRPKVRIQIEFGDLRSPSALGGRAPFGGGLTGSPAVWYVGARFWGAAQRGASSHIQG